MAVFHYTIELLPFDDAGKFARIMHERTTDESRTLVWDSQPSESSLRELRSLLPIDTSWGPCEEYVSSVDTWNSDLRIWHHDVQRKNVESIIFRLSAVAFPAQLIARIVAIANGNYWQIGAMESQCVFPPSAENIIEDFRKSRAARFLEDPESVMIEASQSIDRNRDRQV
ncbi:MAG: hypothetical protein FJ308_13345 [Planctomycetes bacterium]|nr:hypothetical protein [Planctomycetota bacterium]